MHRQLNKERHREREMFMGISIHIHILCTYFNVFIPAGIALMGISPIPIEISNGRTPVITGIYVGAN